MSTVKHLVAESINKAGLDEFLWKEFEKAGYGGVNVTKTPMGTNIVIFAMRPGIVIGRGGETIKALAKILEDNFHLPNPQISVAEIEVPELNPYVIASRISSALKRGVHFRRAGFWALSQVMEVGALGAEIIISGKMRTERSRAEKFRDGYLPKSGETSMKSVRRAAVHVQLKPGIFGVRVAIMPPNVEFPDKLEMLEVKAPTIEETLETPTSAGSEEPKKDQIENPEAEG